MVPQKRTGKDSRCCTEHASPLRWHDFTDAGLASIREFQAWLTTLRPFARDFVTGSIEALLDEAAAGRLEDTGDARTPIKPAHPNPAVDELRLTQLSKKLRLYHGEPARLPTCLIALHLHIKTTTAAQRGEIALATRRFVNGCRTNWGIKNPLHNLRVVDILDQS